ncbi:hypothetical protein BOTCAL_0268g00120 [Botryotinia calthae]|uniref:Uncharacterized protein n=1 Tax=Botryotinia calthae TaxID=38488 RepID=A0A4Y8CVX2_9HELO|nr:hypothetical protein BOTCAL_0268g00120 [Botryotinia calthae]
MPGGDSRELETAGFQNPGQTHKSDRYLLLQVDKASKTKERWFCLEPGTFKGLGGQLSENRHGKFKEL